MGDWLKNIISDGINNGLKDLNETVNKKNGLKINIDLTTTGTSAYDSITSVISPTKQQQVDSQKNKIINAKAEIATINSQAKGGVLTEDQKNRITRLNSTITAAQAKITTLQDEIKKDEDEAKRKIEDAQKRAEKNGTKKTSKSTAQMQKEIDANLKSTKDDMLTITIANAAVENEDKKKTLQKVQDLQKENEELEKQKKELKKQIDDIEALKKNGVVLSSEQEENLAVLKKQYDNFDSEARKNSIESYIVTTFNSEKIISDLSTSFTQEFNSILSGQLVSVLKENAYGGLTDTLASVVESLGTSTANKNQIVQVNNNTKKKLQLDASNLISSSIKDATSSSIGNIVDSISKNGIIGKALGPTVQKTLNKAQTDTITKVTYGALNAIEKNQDLVQIAKFYYTYQQIMLLSEELSFKNISNLLISTAKKIWVKERDKLIKDVTSKISISASGVKINL